MKKNNRFLRIMQWIMMVTGVLLFIPFVVLSYLETFGVRVNDPNYMIFSLFGVCCFALGSCVHQRCEMDEQEECYEEEIAELKSELAKYKSAEQSDEE